MIQTIKLTLNDHDQFDAVIMDFFVDKKNLQGYIRQFCYEQIKQLERVGNGAIIAPPVPASTPQSEVQVLTPKKKDKEVVITPEIKKKLANFG